MAETTTRGVGTYGAAHVTGGSGTLNDAIRDGEVPKPPRCNWNEWQVWRKSLGRRPATAAAGGTTSGREEAQLWKATMEELYGADWQIDLAVEGQVHTARQATAGAARGTEAQTSAETERAGRGSEEPIELQDSPGGWARVAGSPRRAVNTPEEARSPVTWSP